LRGGTSRAPGEGRGDPAGKNKGSSAPAVRKRTTELQYTGTESKIKLAGKGRAAASNGSEQRRRI